MFLTEACIKKPVFAWMLMAATVVFGGVAATRIGVSQFPDVDFPTVNVNVTWEGAAPEAMETDVVEVLEEAITQVEGVRSMSSSSSQGQANITVEFDISRDIDLALQDITTRMSQAQRRLPAGMDPPVVSKSNPEDQPILWVGVSGPYPRSFVADVARYRIKEKLQTVTGIGEIQMGGYLDRNVRIWIDAEKLDAHQLVVTDVIDALSREHIELPAGRIETEGREVSVRVLGEAFDLKTLEQIVVKQESGAPVRLGDVALVEDGFEDMRRASRINGETAQGMGIRKQRGANAVAVAKDVREKLAEIQATLPDDLVIGINFDSTKFIEQSVHHIELELLLAVVLTGLVCWMFLGSLSSTLNVVLAIPMSLLGTVAVIYFLGFTLNTFTLLALSLSVGIVVDDAIMVMENIFRHAEEGKDRVTAARVGTAEITFAALAATLAVVAIFVPIIFMEGVIGRFFLQFGITLSIAVLLSYLEAITLAPARCAQLLKTGKDHAASRSWLGRKVDAGFERLQRGYQRALPFALRRPWLPVVGGFGLFIGALFVFKALPTEFVPSQDQSRVQIRMITAVGSTLEETDRIFLKAEAIVSARPEVDRVFSVVGGFGGAGVNGGMLMLMLKPKGEGRDITHLEFMAQMRKELNGIPGLRAVVMDSSQSGFTAQRGMPIEFSVRGPDWDQLVVLSSQVQDELRESGFAVDIDTDYQLGMPELRVTPLRERAADLGIPMEEIAMTTNALVGGLRVGKYTTGGRRVDVRMRLLADQRKDPDDIGHLRVRTAGGEMVPLSTVVTQEERPALQSITRKDRERAISIFANVAPGKSQGDALAFVETLGRDLPKDYHLKLQGASVTYSESFGGLLFAFLLGIGVAYMVLASQFNSFLHPVTVLTILPLSLIGAAIALFITGNTLNIFSMIGLLLLMGIVKKNSIILVDFANQTHEAQGGTARDAMATAAPTRLRPILMTSIATMMAAIPAALALGDGSEVRAPMAIAVLGGLVVSTLLSLFVVPAFYVLADDIRGKIFKNRRPSVPASPPIPAESHSE
jgi:multidrug efflux pump